MDMDPACFEITRPMHVAVARMKMFVASKSKTARRRWKCYNISLTVMDAWRHRCTTGNHVFQIHSCSGHWMICRRNTASETHSSLGIHAPLGAKRSVTSVTVRHPFDFCVRSNPNTLSYVIHCSAGMNFPCFPQEGTRLNMMQLLALNLSAQRHELL